jgi:hypothetical protein
MPDLNDNQPSPVDTSSTPDAQTDVQSAQTDQQSTDSQQSQQTSQPVPVQQQAQQPSQGQPTVSNAAPANSQQQPSDSSDPAIQHAGRFYRFAQALAGGPQYRTTIDPSTGAVSRTQVPVSRGQLGLAIAMEAISGALSGLSQQGPGATGRAALAGAQTVGSQMQQARQQQEQQAAQDAKSRTDALVRAASIADVNANIIRSTAEAEGRGADTLAKIADTNRPLIDAYDEQGQVLAHNMTQDELMEGMKSGKYDSTAMIGPIDGYRLLGGGKVEATHALITDPAAKVPLTREQWQDFSDSHVQGFPKTANIPDNIFVPGTVVARANEQKSQFQLAQMRHDEVADALRQSDDPNVQQLADQIPTVGSLLDDPKRGAGLATALNHFASYTSHADLNHGGRDLYESLQAMAAPSRPDPNNKGQFIPNRDAPYSNIVAQAFSPDGSVQGGWNVLRQYHDEVAPLEISNEGQAADVLASSEPGSRAYKYAQRWIASNTAQKTAIVAAEAKARQEANPKPTPASLTQPDALGFVPTVTDAKTANSRFNSFKKNVDALAQTEGTYQQFQSILNDLNAGKDMTGAQSVVGLFDAIGISAAPLAGRGFRVSNNVIAEHAQARGWLGALQQKLLSAKNGDVITPDQLRSYANVAIQARQSQYVNLANEMHNSGISADAALPTGNGQKIDPATASIFFRLSGGDPNKARAAAIQKGWAIK